MEDWAKPKEMPHILPANQQEVGGIAPVSVCFDNTPDNGDTAPEATAAPPSQPSRQTRDASRRSAPMTYAPQSQERSNTHVADDEVEHLARKALLILNQTGESGSVSTPFAQLFALTDAYLDVDGQSRHDILARILRQGVTPKQVVDDVVPATARYMGKLWMQDRLSFADVSIGTARLQETVRAMTLRKTRPTRNAKAPSILLIVPRSEHHTLGIFVLSEQFRALGCHVHVMVGSHAVEVVQQVRKQSFDMIGISCGGRRSLGAVRDLIKSIRRNIPKRHHISVGGAITELDLDVMMATGADSVCTNATAALQNANLELPNTEAHTTSL
jgi:methanogenic corrinoid protein MtbC1